MPASHTLIDRLRHADAYPHPAGDIGLIETHISWVLLAGEFAYKLKKPLDLGFLDFRTLDSRRHFCAEEVRLNRRFAPQLYLKVVAITETSDGVRMDGDGEAVEYAVCMRRFAPEAVLDAQLDAGLLTRNDMRQLAGRMVEWHAAAPRAPSTQRTRTLQLIADQILDNFAPLENALCKSGAPATHDPGADLLVELRRWTERRLDELRPVIAARFDAGHVRECHGDLHLRNLVRLDDGITPFDCIEFDADLRHCDVMSDGAFLTMDLTARGHSALAAEFLNRYLERSGDYDGARVYTLYFVYRCLVRAKIAVFQSAERQTRAERQSDLDEARRYLSVAAAQSRPRRPCLVAMHGLSGAGKSHVAHELMLRLPALRLRSDIERKRMQGLDEHADSDSEPGGGLYAAAVTDALYARLLTMTAALLRAGHCVIVDASFLARRFRQDARDVARQAKAAYVLCDVVADETVLRQRIVARQQRGDDPSEAGLAVLAHQHATRDRLTADEEPDVLRCGSDDAPESMIERLNRLIDSA